MSVRQGTNTIAGAVGKYPLNERNITNCITEIPQDIKLELNAGVLTLKAGSKVYVPNGNGVFDEVVIANDRSNINSNNGQLLVLAFENNISILAANQCFSGSSAPSGYQYMFWYDTANNLVKFTENSGSTWSTNTISLPVALITVSNGAISSIDQIFNGFGYIGSTVFALPGVKGLIPDGRNADGSLKSIETAISIPKIMTMKSYMASRNCAPLTMSENGELGGMDISNTDWETVKKLSDIVRPSYYAYYYCLEDNLVHYFNGSGVEFIQQRAIIGSFNVDSNLRITSFIPKIAFHAVDYSDTEYIGHQAMPSNRYIDLTLGASGATYVAPADGYFTYMDISGGVGLASLANWTNGLVNGINAPSSTWVRRVFLPAKKGDTVQLIYENGGTNQTFRFIYAQGAQ